MPSAVKGAVHGGLWPSPAAPSKAKEQGQSGPCWIFNIPKQRDCTTCLNSYLMLQHPQDENLYQRSPQCRSTAPYPGPWSFGRALRCSSIHLPFREQNCFNTGLSKWHQTVWKVSPALSQSFPSLCNFWSPRISPSTNKYTDISKLGKNWVLHRQRAQNLNVTGNSSRAVLAQLGKQRHKLRKPSKRVWW